MNRKTLSVIVLFFLSIPFFLSSIALGEETKPFVPDKALCAKMLRFGKEAYVRGKYLDAKEYFRKAVQADPASQKAWRYYDLATVFALAFSFDWQLTKAIETLPTLCWNGRRRFYSKER